MEESYDFLKNRINHWKQLINISKLDSKSRIEYEDVISKIKKQEKVRVYQENELLDALYLANNHSPLRIVTIKERQTFSNISYSIMRQISPNFSFIITPQIEQSQQQQSKLDKQQSKQIYDMYDSYYEFIGYKNRNRLLEIKQQAQFFTYQLMHDLFLTLVDLTKILFHSQLSLMYQFTTYTNKNKRPTSLQIAAIIDLNPAQIQRKLKSSNDQYNQQQCQDINYLGSENNNTICMANIIKQGGSIKTQKIQEEDNFLGATRCYKAINSKKKFLEYIKIVSAPINKNLSDQQLINGHQNSINESQTQKNSFNCIKDVMADGEFISFKKVSQLLAQSLMKNIVSRNILISKTIEQHRLAILNRRKQYPQERPKTIISPICVNKQQQLSKLEENVKKLPTQKVPSIRSKSTSYRMQSDLPTSDQITIEIQRQQKTHGTEILIEPQIILSSRRKVGVDLSLIKQRGNNMRVKQIVEDSTINLDNYNQADMNPSYNVSIQNLSSNLISRSQTRRMSPLISQTPTVMSDIEQGEKPKEQNPLKYGNITINQKNQKKLNLIQYNQIKYSPIYHYSTNLTTDETQNISFERILLSRLSRSNRKQYQQLQKKFEQLKQQQQLQQKFLLQQQPSSYQQKLQQIFTIPQRLSPQFPRLREKANQSPKRQQHSEDSKRNMIITENIKKIEPFRASFEIFGGSNQNSNEKMKQKKQQCDLDSSLSSFSSISNTQDIQTLTINQNENSSDGGASVQIVSLLENQGECLENKTYIINQHLKKKPTPTNLINTPPPRFISSPKYNSPPLKTTVQQKKSLQIKEDSCSNDSNTQFQISNIRESSAFNDDLIKESVPQISLFNFSPLKQLKNLINRQQQQQINFQQNINYVRGRAIPPFLQNISTSSEQEPEI